MAALQENIYPAEKGDSSMKHRKITLALVGALVLIVIAAAGVWAQDPFAAGADALAIGPSDGSSSLRAKKKLRKIAADMVLLKVTAVDDRKFPHCVLQAKVLKGASSKAKHFRLLARGKIYRFAPQLKRRRRGIDLKDPITQNNLGGCYYPKGTRLVVKVSGVDLKQKTFKAAEIYLK